MFRLGKKEEEFIRLCALYSDKKKEFAKASRTRWFLTVLGFAVFYFALLYTIYYASNGSVGAATLAILIAISIIVSGLHVFINALVFSTVFQKRIAEWRRLDAIMERIMEIVTE